MHRFAFALGSAFLLAISPGTASAKVLEESATGFLVEQQAELKTDAKSAYAAFTNVGAWWDAAHSYTGDAKNMTMDTKPGGCWCETLPNGGFVKHMEVIHAAPGAMLVLSGGLGPLQSMGIAGSMTIRFDAAKDVNVTKVTLRYDVGGRDSKNFTEISKGVDGVLASQFARYSSFVTTGKPN